MLAQLTPEGLALLRQRPRPTTSPACAATCSTRSTPDRSSSSAASSRPCASRPAGAGSRLTWASPLPPRLRVPTSPTSASRTTPTTSWSSPPTSRAPQPGCSRAAASPGRAWSSAGATWPTAGPRRRGGLQERQRGHRRRGRWPTPARSSPASPRASAAQPSDVLVASTGVIGRHYPMDRVRAGIAALAAPLPLDDADAGRPPAIMTTDTVRQGRRGRRRRLGGAASSAWPRASA